MHSMLVIDGRGPKEPPEAELIVQLARRSDKFDLAVAVHGATWDRKLLDKPWSIIWFAGHVTIYQRKQLGSLEWKDRHGRFHRFATHEDFQKAKARLLVLSGCNTGPLGLRSKQLGPFYAYPVVDGAHKRVYPTADFVLGYDGTLYTNQALVFAASFFTQLVEEMRRDRIDAEVIESVHKRACTAVDDDCWELLWELG